MRTSTALLLILGQTAVFGLVVAEARLLATQVGTLGDRLAATELAAHEAKLQMECETALWPAIPEHCLQRVISKE